MTAPGRVPRIGGLSGDQAEIRCDPTPFGLDGNVLTDLVKAARQSNTDALVIAKNGTIIVSFPQTQMQSRVAMRSVTKSIVSLALGDLLDRGIIASLEEPLKSFFPNLRGAKEAICLRHLLTHTSGISPRGPVTSAWNAEDYLNTSRLRFRPGTHYSYSDASTELLSDIVAGVTRMRLDEFVEATLFDPLGIRCWDWQRRDDGTPHAAFGLELTAPSLLRIGMLIANGGEWAGRRIVSKRWLKLLRQPGTIIAPYHSLLWYLRGGRIVVRQRPTKRREHEASGLRGARALRELDGRAYSMDAYWREVRRLLPPASFLEIHRQHSSGDSMLTARIVGGRRALYAHGWLGQHLVIYPSESMVAVRLRREGGDARARRRESFPQLLPMLEMALKSGARARS
jgi:CubicO group peptidase (beta-lactamase class C family)